MIRRGKIRATMEQASSGTREIGQLGKADFFGDRSLLRDEPRPVTVTALETVETYTIGRELFEEARRASIPFINRILAVYDSKVAIQ